MERREGMDWSVTVQMMHSSFEDHPIRNLPALHRDHNSFLASASGRLPSSWPAAIVRVSTSAGGTEVLADYGKHDLAPERS